MKRRYASFPDKVVIPTFGATVICKRSEAIR
jgi:hypothetical protein